MVSLPNYNFEPFGEASVSSQGQVTIPAPARERSGLVAGTPVLVFVDRDGGYVLLTHRPDPEDLRKIAPQLIDAASRAATKKQASS